MEGAQKRRCQASRVSRLGQIVLVPTATACGAAGRLKEAEWDTQRRAAQSLGDQRDRSEAVLDLPERVLLLPARIAKTEDL